MSEKHHIIPVWFFVGVLLLVYGFLIFASGLDAPVWWGGLLFVLGLIYCIKFSPKRQA